MKKRLSKKTRKHMRRAKNITGWTLYGTATVIEIAAMPAVKAGELAGKAMIDC